MAFRRRMAVGMGWWCRPLRLCGESGICVVPVVRFFLEMNSAACRINSFVLFSATVGQVQRGRSQYNRYS